MGDNRPALSPSVLAAEASTMSKILEANDGDSKMWQAASHRVMEEMARMSVEDRRSFIKLLNDDLRKDGHTDVVGVEKDSSGKVVAIDFTSATLGLTAHEPIYSNHSCTRPGFDNSPSTPHDAKTPDVNGKPSSSGDKQELLKSFHK